MNNPKSKIDIYRHRLVSSITNFEVLLNLRKNGDTKFIEIDKFIVMADEDFRYFDSEVSSKSSKGMTMINQFESHIAEVSLISEGTSFLALPLLDFRMYDRKDYLLELILDFRSFNDIKHYREHVIKPLIEYLVYVENQGRVSNLKSSLGYKVLRNFILLFVYGKYTAASTYATFLKDQILLSSGYSPRVQFSDEFRHELSLSIKKERERFGKRILKSIGKGIKDLADSGVNTIKEKTLEKVTDIKSNVSHKVNVATGKVTSDSVDYYERNSNVMERRPLNTRQSVKQSAPRVTSTDRDQDREFFRQDDVAFKEPVIDNLTKDRELFETDIY